MSLFSRNNPRTNIIHRFLVSYALLTISLLIFILGFSFGRVSEDVIPAMDKDYGEVKNQDEIPDYLTENVDFREFWQVWEYVQENYVNDDVSDTKLFYGAMEGLVNSLDDPYSVFLNPEISDKFSQELSGSFEGIGAEIGIRDDVLTIIAPLVGTPAYKAGLQAGDLILEIDGEVTRGVSLEEAVSKIRGEKGSEVVLTIFTEGDDEPRPVSIVRGTIEIDSVVFSRAGEDEDVRNQDVAELEEGDIAYIELHYFNENTLSDWNQTIQKIIELNPKGLVLDLRNNPGGFLITAIDIAGEWVNGQDIVLEKLRSGEQIAHTSRRTGRLDGIPTVVLVNGGSASGAEIVAGALQDYGAATIVGEQTFGKGSVQDLKTFKDGSSVKLTIAEWLTPFGRNINEEGITPDVIVELTREDFENDLDPQLDQAFEILRGSN